MKLWHKISISVVFAGTAIGGGMVLIDNNQQIQINSLPDTLKIQVPVSSLVATQSVTDATLGNVVQYEYKDKPLETASNELIDRRTANSRTFQVGKQIEIAFDAVEPYYEDTDGTWWTLAQATTTQQAFNLQTQSAFGISKAYAATSFLTSSPGTGNQTFSVPVDWNNSNNQVACIGSGGTGGLGGSTSVQGGGGGGGAYASTTNITLTPGGTAIYAIGASATSTAAGATAGSRETYFNGTASSTASLTCDWGRLGAIGGAGAGTGGSTAYSIGITLFAGGNGGAGAGTANRPGGGGGGSGGEFGIGKVGGDANITTNGGGGSGGGGSNGRTSSVGNAGSAATGGAGGNGTGGTGGGAANTAATAGSGGGGGGGTGGTTSQIGTVGAIDTSFDSTHGAGGGGGGGSGASGGGIGGSGGGGATYGGGGGGTGSGAAGGGTVAGTGGQGLIVIIYTPAVAPSATGIGNKFLIQNGTQMNITNGTKLIIP